MYDDNIQDEYLEATKDAVINQDGEEEARGLGYFMISLSVLSLFAAGYFGYGYINSNSNVLMSTPLQQEQFLSHGSLEHRENEQEKSASELKRLENELQIYLETEYESDTSDQNKVFSTPDVVKKEKNYFVITVKEGDTLASLSKKHLGNEMEYKRIVSFNKGLENDSVLKIGQKIYIPR